MNGSKMMFLGMFAMMAIGASGCGLTPGGNAAGGGTLPSANCGIYSTDPACKDKAVFGGHVDCNGGKVNFTYRDSKGGAEGRVDTLIPIPWEDGTVPACGSAQVEGGGVVAFAGEWKSKNGNAMATVLVGADPLATDVDVLGIGVGASCIVVEGDCTYVNIQALTHGNVVLH